ncbi:hypothetical protein HHX47_DHR7000001 [Lentinula edodes]|nr:hypothetical protein HHX47_DHR7000001 [Lentinula edodes]
MTEYDYSPEGYQRYLDTQRRISKWVQNTNAHASEFRSPFGTFNPIRVSEESSSSRTRTSTVSSKPHGDRNIIERGRGMDDRERRHSMSATTFRQGASGASNVDFHTQRSPAHTSQVRHSYSYSPAPQESYTATRTAYAAPTQSRRAQSLSSPPSQPQSRHRAHHHHHNTPSQSAAHASRPHKLDSPRRSTTPPDSHRRHITHRPSSSHRSNHHHQHHSRSQSTPRPSSKLGSPLAVSPTYAVVGGRAYVSNPGGYLVIPPKGKKLSVVACSLWSVILSVCRLE